MMYFQENRYRHSGIRKSSIRFCKRTQLGRLSQLRSTHSLEVSFLPFTSSQYTFKKSRFERSTSVLYFYLSSWNLTILHFCLLLQAQFSFCSTTFASLTFTWGRLWRERFSASPSMPTSKTNVQKSLSRKELVRLSNRYSTRSSCLTGYRGIIQEC